LYIPIILLVAGLMVLSACTSVLASPQSTPHPAAFSVPAGGSGSSPASLAHTSAGSGFYDNFKDDSSLDSSIWTTTGAVATNSAPYMSNPPAGIVPPALTFGGGNGMEFTGVTGEFQIAAVQSVQSFAPPFYVTGEVNGSAVFGNAASLAILSGNGNSGTGIFGNLNSSNQGYYGINYFFPLLNHTGHPTIYASPQLDTWYVYNISVTSAGAASLVVSSNGATLGTSPGLSVGVGPFYIMIVEFEGIPAYSGTDFVNWSYVAEGALPSSSSSPGSSSGSSSTNFSSWWWVLVIVIVVVALLALVRIRRKRRGKAPLLQRASPAQGATQQPPPQ
jgi:hypothetical protein